MGSRAGSRWRLKLAVLGGSVLFALLLGEAGMRIRQVVKYGTAGPTVNRFEVDAESGLRIPKRGYDSGRIRIDSRGFRNPELTVPKPAGRIRVAFLGASTTYCAEASSNAATWPARVCDELGRRFPAASFDYVNAGVPGYSVLDSKRNLVSRVAGLQPDVLVIYHGTNDLSGITRAMAEEQGLVSGRTDRPSALARVSVLWHWIEKNYQVWARTRDARSGRNRLRFDPAAAAEEFRGRLDELLREAKARAPVVAVATFAWHPRREQDADELLRACNTALFYMPWMSVEGLLDASEAWTGTIRDAARAARIDCIEAAEGIPGDDLHFADSVHLTDAGCRRMAALVADTLSRDPELQRLVERASGEGTAAAPEGAGAPGNGGR